MKKPKFSELVRHLLFGWLVAAMVEYLLLPKTLQALSQLAGIAAMSMPRLLLLTVVIATGMWVLSLWFSVARFERWAMAGAFAVIGAVSVTVSFSWEFLILCTLIFACFVVYAVFGWSSTEPELREHKSHWAFPVITGVLAVAAFTGICIWGVYRVRTFSTPTYDFGIFAQMFHNMKETGLPITTVERDGPLSHFAVHVSPIYYLLLPFYYLFPTPATLQVLQAAVIVSAVIPMWLLGKQHGHSPLLRTLLCALLLLVPTTAGSTSYDIHENCFLLPLVLWLMYAIDSKKLWLVAICGALTLAVKEDAAVYVAVAAIYWLFRTLLQYDRTRRKELIGSIALLICSVVYFYFVTDYLAQHGDGVMTYRYDNFMYDGSDSLFSVVKAVLLCPAKMLFEMVDPEKTPYILQTLLPLLCLPLITRKYERYLLLIPYVLLNLMSDYQYQHNVMFQYNFGSAAFLLYLTAVNLSDLRPRLARLLPAAVAVCVSIGFFSSLIVPKIVYYPSLYSKYSAFYENVTQTLDQIPDDVSVATHTFYTTYLSERDQLYDIRYCSEAHLLSCEFVVVKSNSETSYTKYKKYGKTGYDGLVYFLETNGYVPYYNYGSSIVIYRKAS